MWPQNKHSLRAGATFSPPGQGDCFMWNLQVSGVGEVENFCLPKPLQGYRNSMLVALAAESLILGVSGGWGRENDQGRKWAFVARAGCLCDLQGLRGSSQSRQPGSFINLQSKGTTIPREVRLADFQPSFLPGEAVSPCFGPIFHVGFPETPNGSCDRRHGSGTLYISKIPIPIFRCLLPCAYPSQNIPFYYEQYSPFQWRRIVSRFMNHPHSEKVFLLDYGLGLFEGSWWEMYCLEIHWRKRKHSTCYSQQGTALTCPVGDSGMKVTSQLHTPIDHSDMWAHVSYGLSISKA